MLTNILYLILSSLPCNSPILSTNIVYLHTIQIILPDAIAMFYSLLSHCYLRYVFPFKEGKGSMIINIDYKYTLCLLNVIYCIY